MISIRNIYKHFDDLKLGQELDPITGIPTKSSEWYSSTMLMYLYATQRLKNKSYKVEGKL